MLVSAVEYPEQQVTYFTHETTTSMLMRVLLLTQDCDLILVPFFSLIPSWSKFTLTLWVIYNCIN